MPAKKTNSDGKVKIRGDRKFADDLNETENKFVPDNPIKRQIKINQLPWTDKQKEFFRIALDYNTKIVFVNGPAGTSKTLLSVYCGL